ncbi:sialate O-acetylesterase [Sediminicola luteus]|nr:sialate O-acetylesterase [Sediminicola luteus]
MKPIKTIISVLFVCWAAAVQAKIWTPSIISDNMVLQQQSEVILWGWTTQTAERLEVSTTWNNEPITIEAKHGKWSVVLKTPKSGGTHSIRIQGHETLLITNILMGEVWLCSGQSNMEWRPTWGLLNAEAEIAQANYPEIRFFSVGKKVADHPQDDLQGEWVVCNPKNFKAFSSVAYFFGRELHGKLKVPVGLINSSWGGTPIETWIKESEIKADANLSEEALKVRSNKWRPHEPGRAYNAMIAPLTDFSVAGCIWYQGESNRENAHSYYRSFPLLIDSWRSERKQKVPFYFVQIAPFDYKDPSGLKAAVVRDAQLHTFKAVANTGIVVTNDIGNLKDIHPQNKQEVGRRLALWALNKTYEKQEVVPSGPIYKSASPSGNQMILEFDYAQNGLQSKGKYLTDFFMAADDRVFYPAKAIIKGDKVWVQSKKVAQPKAVRFAFSATAQPNLYNAEGLPASAFRTDDWEINLSDD